MANSVDPDLTVKQQCDQGEHCLHRPVCQSLWWLSPLIPLLTICVTKSLSNEYVTNKDRMSEFSYFYISKPAITFNWASSWENLFLLYANNKGADQPAHPRSLISTFVVRSLDRKIPVVAMY